MEPQKTPNCQSNPEKEQSRALLLPVVKLYHKAVIIKTVRYGHKHRHTDQQNREPRNKPTRARSIS